MIYWAQLLHFYQPPTQSPGVLRKICDESYRPLINVLLQYPYAHVTVNINGVLVEMLHECGHDDVLNGLVKLARRGQIEFTGSGKYHPILPLIPQREAERQIQLNSRTNRYYLGKAYKPKGFSPPELCYSREIVASIMSSGHAWIIVSGVACANSWPTDVIHYIQEGDRKLAVFFRDDILSNKISFQTVEPTEFLQNLSQIKGSKEKIYVVTAMDAETFGHHIQDWEELFLAEVYERIEPSGDMLANLKQATVLAHQYSLFLENSQVTREVQAVTLSQLIDIFPPGEPVEPAPSSWSTSKEELADGNPYPLWRGKGNELHRLQWEHLQLCIELVYKAIDVTDSDESKRLANNARALLDRAFYSCQFWWASRRPMWDVNLIYKGLAEQLQAIVNAYRAINISQAREIIKREYYHKLIAARDSRNKIIDSLFQ